MRSVFILKLWLVKEGVYFGSEAHISQPTAHDKDLIAGRIILQDCFDDLV